MCFQTQYPGQQNIGTPGNVTFTFFSLGTLFAFVHAMNFIQNYYATKGHVTRGNVSCNLSRNDDDWKTLQVAEGVSHVHNISSQLATLSLEIVCNFFLRQLESLASKIRALIA